MSFGGRLIFLKRMVWEGLIEKVTEQNFEGGE